MAAMGTVMMVLQAQESASATKDSKENPASSASAVTTGPTAQVRQKQPHLNHKLKIHRKC